MTSLLSQINEEVKEQEHHTRLVIEKIKELFGEEAATTVVEGWEKGRLVKEDQKHEPIADIILQEVESAAMARAGEREWMQQVSQDTEELESKKLGLKATGTPTRGDFVMIGDSIGRIVDVDEPGKQVMIQNKSGEERVFPMKSLLGPKQLKNKKEKAWALKQ